jgi:hypothetical protein
MAAKAVVVATAARWQWPAWQQKQQLSRSATLAATAACWEARWQRGGGGGNTALATAVWHMLTMTATVTMMTMIDY